MAVCLLLSAHRAVIFAIAQLSCLVLFGIGKCVCRYFEVIRVRLNVVDINDNAPTFSQQRVSITLSEQTPPKDLFPLMPATDIDSPANGVAGYRLTVLDERPELDVDWIHTWVGLG